MSADEKTDEQADEKADEQDQTDKPELSDEGKEKVDEMQKAYDDDRPTAVLPGTDNTITGVAVNEWIDDDGNPKFGKDEQKEKSEGKDEQKEKAEGKDQEQDDQQKDKEQSQEDAG